MPIKTTEEGIRFVIAVIQITIILSNVYGNWLGGGADLKNSNCSVTDHELQTCKLTARGKTDHGLQNSKLLCHDRPRATDFQEYRNCGMKTMDNRLNAA